MLGTFFDFGSDMTSTTLGTMGVLLEDFSPFIIMIVSVLLTVVVVKIVIGILHK